MNPEEMAFAFDALLEVDPECDHGYADDTMVATLRELGYGKAMDIYESLQKWYA